MLNCVFEVFFDLVDDDVGEDGVSIFCAFALANQKEFAVEVDIGYLNFDGFGSSYAAGVEQADEDFMFVIGSGVNHILDVLFCWYGANFLFAFLERDVLKFSSHDSAVVEV